MFLSFCPSSCSLDFYQLCKSSTIQVFLDFHSCKFVCYIPTEDTTHSFPWSRRSLSLRKLPTFSVSQTWTSYLCFQVFSLALESSASVSSNIILSLVLSDFDNDMSFIEHTHALKLSPTLLFMFRVHCSSHLSYYFKKILKIIFIWAKKTLSQANQYFYSILLLYIFFHLLPLLLNSTYVFICKMT